MTEQNVDSAEIRKFEALDNRWWDPEGDFKPLHDINPARRDYIIDKVGNTGAGGVRGVSD